MCLLIAFSPITYKDVGTRKSYTVIGNETFCFMGELILLWTMMHNDGTVSMTITRVDFSKLSLSLLLMLLLLWPIHMINAFVESTFKAAKFNAAVIDHVSSIV